MKELCKIISYPTKEVEDVPVKDGVLVKRE